MSSVINTTERTISSDQDATNPPPRSCCYSQFWMDLTGTFRCAPSFRSIDAVHRTDGSMATRVIDIPASFSPPIGMLQKTANKKDLAMAKAAVLVWKLLVMLLQIVIFFAGLSKYPVFWFGYLTNWALVFSMVYSALSLANTIYPISTNIPSSNSKDKNKIRDDYEEDSTESIEVRDEQLLDNVDAINDTESRSPIVNNDEELQIRKVTDVSKNISENGIVSTRTLITWAFFTVASLLQMLVSAPYWITVYFAGKPAHTSSEIGIIINHGVLCVLILMDGFLVNRIPIRLHHWLELFLPVILSYVIWMVLQSPLGFDIDNPYAEELGVDDDKIYT